ncbi:MAG: short-chain dehydrogenase [Cereibacter sphaeroides]|uniref:Short-chain dehydrogenase n=1 Tax=Cereibacter sphaeroides TaxID=1063 RepID=A0A2W5S8P5_CERSP|nr:MAG: short-chain dehydrogenase [Cereibacter sphaeroides]
MEISLAGKRLIVTGSTQGLGETIARAALCAGAEAVMLSGRHGERGRALAAELGPRAHFHQADLAEPSAPTRLFAASLAAMGQVDLLVNAAALTTRASMLDGTVELWDQLFAVNARAPYMLMGALIRHLLERGAAGSIVNIQSVNAPCGLPELAIYSASKGALQTLTRNAANAHMADRIRVNGINMGWVATPGEQQMQAETLGNGPDWEKAAAASQPLGRLLTMEEVANLSLYLLSDLSGVQTGTVTDLEQRVFGAYR